MNGISIGPDAHSDSSRKWGHGLWLYFVLFAIPLVGYIHRLVINILIDPIGVEFGLTDTQASLLQGPPFALVYGLMVIPMGLLADRGSRVLLLGSGAILWSMGTLMCGFAPTFAWLFAARMLVGLGEAALMPAAVSLIGDSFPENRRGLAIGIFFMGVNAGFSSAYAVGGIALDLAQAGALAVTPFLAEMSPWRQVFFVLALPGFILPLLLVSIGEPERRTAIQHYRVNRSMRRLFSSQPLATILVLLILQATVIAVADNGIYAWLPRLLSRLYELGSTEIGLMLGAIVAIAGTLGGPLAGRLTDHWVKRKGMAGPLLVIAVAIGAATVAAPMFALGSVWLVYVGYGDLGDCRSSGKRDHVRIRIDCGARPATRPVVVADHLGNGACRARCRANDDCRGAGGVCLRTRQGRCGNRRIGSATVLHCSGSGGPDFAKGKAFAGTD